MNTLTSELTDEDPAKLPGRSSWDLPKLVLETVSDMASFFNLLFFCSRSFIIHCSFFSCE